MALNSPRLKLLGPMAWVIASGITTPALAGEPAATNIIAELESSLPRPFGYLVGDWIEHSVAFTVAPGWRLDEASLPKPGSLDYWLDLLATEVEVAPAPNGQHYRVNRRFQTFYFNRETKSLEVPATVVTLLGEGRKELFELPGFEFTTSTLHETAGVRRDEEGFYMRPDTPAPKLPPVRSWRGVIGLAVALAALAGLLPGWFGFGGASRPFAVAFRHLRNDVARGQGKLSDGAWLALHRAFDTTAGQALMQADVPAFLNQHPRYAALRPQLEAFFTASSARFFGRDAGVSRLNSDELLKLARQLARLESVR